MNKVLAMAVAATAFTAAPAFAQSMFDNQRTDRTWGHVGVSGGQLPATPERPARHVEV